MCCLVTPCFTVASGGPTCPAVRGRRSSCPSSSACTLCHQRPWCIKDTAVAPLFATRWSSIRSSSIRAIAERGERSVGAPQPRHQLVQDGRANAPDDSRVHVVEVNISAYAGALELADLMRRFHQARQIHAKPLCHLIRVDQHHPRLPLQADDGREPPV